MGQNNLVLVDTEDLKEMIHEAVVDAVNECLPAAAIIPEDEKKYYTIREVARKWGVCHQTIWRYAKEGRIKSAKVGRLVRFDKAYIDGLKSLGEVKTPGRTYITKAERNMRQRK